MPPSDEILAGLTKIATEAAGVGIAWHVFVGLWLSAISAGFRPQLRGLALLLSVPLASVSVLAWIYGNPFNGAVFALAAGLLAWLAGARSADDAAVRRAPWSMALGACLLAFAWVYPHFVVGHSLWRYLYRSPLGAIPCPTLALVCGASLICGGLGTRSWQTVVALLAALYAVFGVLRLGVYIDVFLLAGAVGVLIQAQNRARDAGARFRL
ncbi:MAG: hypothetical protein ABUL60_23885 [Myxococcales bacterium]